MARQTLITTLPDGHFSIADLPEETKKAGFAPLSPALSEAELKAELIRQGVDPKIAADLIEAAKRKGSEIFDRSR